ncbi:MAG: DUF488 domain-containing protein [Gammaproteobacteria bacterium]|nr:DUF488 domain-containing protein [Gammaproteobacteria bacterium]
MQAKRGRSGSLRQAATTVRPTANESAGAIFTLGHSTLPIEQFVALLREHGIERLADIRSVPRSRHNPQYNADELAGSLAAEHIEYVSMRTLGGLRHPRRDSPNTGWRNPSFRGYADYMQTPAFNAALEELIRMGRGTRVAIMCAEAVPWRCHRSLVADALTVHGVPVVEIMPAGDPRMHRLTPFAQVDGMTITYPPQQAELYS